TALYEITRTVSLWMAPILCFTAQDVADHLSRATGEPFDVHGAVRAEVIPSGKNPGQPNRRWTDEIRPRREAILHALEAFRAAGHKSLEAAVTVRPAAAQRPQWEWNRALLTELCIVSKLTIEEGDAPETQIAVAEAPGPTCPRCWRRTGDPPTPGAPSPEMCHRCAGAVAGSAS
ncbi:MAG TPA: hypothetical protein VN962_08320, partial [Polyangia bacterium]|nr:hypothetical protein [Polyangia bacterium]